MDTRIGPTPPDVVTVSSESRPTPSPTKFSDVLASGTVSVVEGAEAAATVLPGYPLTALAVRGPLPVPPNAPTPGLGAMPVVPGALPMPMAGPMMPGLPGATGGLAAEGPGGGSPSTGAAIGTALAAGLPGALMGDGGMQASLIQSQQMNMYYLQLQQEVDAENRTFSTLSNVLKAQNDTVKNAIGNIH
jgi:hypothetical protein